MQLSLFSLSVSLRLFLYPFVSLLPSLSLALAVSLPLCLSLPASLSSSVYHCTSIFCLIWSLAVLTDVQSSACSLDLFQCQHLNHPPTHSSLPSPLSLTTRPPPSSTPRVFFSRAKNVKRITKTYCRKLPYRKLKRSQECVSNGQMRSGSF